ncbi:hypothetical protein FA13DRAFT_1793151 [Coprinellus micaceus]|uniref:Uncharacterized protein n=1 Tax=Coprinellus micaceus TaxID=71717 RepID=A0A4Y7T796_COPMI|nr:hypothetical protein FA13DRAFT_1793151 [Coprinellus micaceus]
MASTPLSHLSRDMPSFSVALTRSSPSGALVEVLSMQDFGHASKRALHLSFQPGDNDPLMKTVDTRFPGLFAYDVEYSNEKNGSHSTTSATPSSASFSTPTGGDEDDTASSASTMGLDRGFDRELDTESGSDTATLSDCDVDPPLHRQPAPLASLVQVPALPPRYQKFEVESTTTAPMCAPGHSLGFPSSGSQDDFHPSRGSLNIVLVILNAFRSLWRRLRKIGGLVFKEFTKDL